jgi:phosphoribosylformylglycinamidine synthase
VRAPIAHAEGCYTDSPAALDALEAEGRVVFRYVDESGERTDAGNPNGSSRSIAGICNAEGNVLGLMPHPERCAEEILGNRDGAGLFAGLIEAAGRGGATGPRRGAAVSTAVEPRVDAGAARELGLSGRGVRATRRDPRPLPTWTELGIASALWSEHCSYKSSKVYLRELPTRGPRVIHGPGENAGVVDVGEGWVAAFKMESHNHPSFIEPYQGAATGVGGILRDVFTMGARPIACMDSLRFGAIDAPRMRHLVDGVVRGIGDYGNCVGIPTVGGETGFHPSYNGNILVNAFAMGLARADGIFLAKARGVGNPVFYVGSRTGRDGIHGATMASEAFDQESEAKRPTVQVGDPFTEKILLEACLEAMRTDAVVAIQDMGAAGLTSSSLEMAGRGGLGLRLDLDRVPLREPGLSAFEIMLSESQERMVVVARRGREEELRRVFERWELEVVPIGELTDDGVADLRFGGRSVARIPIEPLTGSAPEYTRQVEPPADLARRQQPPEVPGGRRSRRRDRAPARHAGARRQVVDLAPVRPHRARQHRDRSRRRRRAAARQGHGDGPRA